MMSGSSAPNSYYDHRFHLEAIKLLPAQYFATNRNVVLVTVLGSCVSVCLRDPVAGVGGMNHFMLPQGEQGGLLSMSARYGVHAMELLINQMMKLGARRDRLQAKVFGAGNVLPAMSRVGVGRCNAQFVLDYLETERIALLAHDLLDVHARKLYFFPLSGRVLVRKLKKLNNRTLLEREAAYSHRLHQTDTGDVDLF
ncbi:chemoreceptor glutamine deamidase CheD [Chitiniphilus purpureus]|uniref:Probable chemoreceptor glutamine deamidase CheD n=1 Tax=Chitiniphilus purpureus TaxID=2981137 RepID=A0ABY6DHY2_9NEIS|nr:chemoreceptor glutamine deamidase CheD [Chitiniphilus sp. CD1]UXY13954.1 chemoreceptor glutamine deamidase CheD [Chitiniphilus sp. CD1]